MGGRGFTAPLVVLLVLAGLAVSVLMLTQRGAKDEPAPAGTPRIISADGLADAAADAKAPVFWAGTRSGERLELTRTKAGRSYVRYLPDGVDAGDKRAAFLTVGTYPQGGAYTVTEASSRRDGMVRRATPGGGLATWSKSKPTSVYLAYPDVNRIVEVFSPNAATAQRLVVNGEVGPVGEVKASEPSPRRLTRP